MTNLLRKALAAGRWVGDNTPPIIWLPFVCVFGALVLAVALLIPPRFQEKIMGGW